jgi:hypothetical protein
LLYISVNLFKNLNQSFEMNVVLTVTKILNPKTTVGRNETGDQVLSLARMRVYSGEGALVAVQDLTDGTIYQGDLAWATAFTTLQAAPDDSGAFILT